MDLFPSPSSALLLFLSNVKIALLCSKEEKASEKAWFSSSLVKDCSFGHCVELSLKILM